MKKFSQEKFVDTVKALRKSKGVTQAQLAELTGINRAMIGRIENFDYIPTIEQIEALGNVLEFEMVDMFVEEKATPVSKGTLEPHRIAVAGTGYVGLSLAVLWRGITM